MRWSNLICDVFFMEASSELEKEIEVGFIQLQGPLPFPPSLQNKDSIKFLGKGIGNLDRIFLLSDNKTSF